MNTEALKSLLLKLNKVYDEAAKRKADYRAEKIKSMIDFFEIKDTTNITHVIVNPKFFPLFKEYFSDVIIVQKASGFVPELKYWQFYNLPELDLTAHINNLTFAETSIDMPQFALVKPTFGIATFGKH